MGKLYDIVRESRCLHRNAFYHYCVCLCIISVLPFFLYAESSASKETYSVSVKNSNNITLIKTEKNTEEQIRTIEIIQGKIQSIDDSNEYNIVINVINVCRTVISYDVKKDIPDIEIMTVGEWGLSFNKNNFIGYNNENIQAKHFAELYKKGGSEERIR